MWNIGKLVLTNLEVYMEEAELDEEIEVLLAQIRSIATSLERIADSFDALLSEIQEEDDLQ